MRPKIIVMSRTRAIEESSFLVHPTVIISISDICRDIPDFADSEWITDVLYLHFDDEESEERGGMTQADAEEIVEFASFYAESDVDMIVHCSAGRSRSAGTAAALMLMINGDDSPIFSSPMYSPNMHCYRQVLDAAKIGYDPEELNEKEARQCRLWTQLAKENGLL